jgi:hypothetical protein
MSRPERSLLYWDYDITTLNIASYGRSYMFMLYLCERFGEEFLTDLVTIEEDGPAGIEKALENREFDYSFNDIFLDWITACTIDLEDFTDGRFGYHTADFTISAANPIFQLPYNAAELKYNLYGFRVSKLYSPPNEFTVKLTNPNPYVMGVSVVINDQNGWSITQMISNNNNNDESYFYFTGEEIDYAYIITSMIDTGTPSAANFNNPGLTAPIKYQTLTILEGHISPTENVNLKFIYIGFGIAFVVTTIRRLRK